MKLYAAQKDYILSYLDRIENATPEIITAARAAFDSNSPEDIIVRTDGNAEASIIIKGLMTPNGPSDLARFFGFEGTAYRDIIEAAQTLGDDPTIDRVRLVMNTPGGFVDGMDATRQALVILAGKKELIAENHGLIASAGYHIATAAPKIVAMSPLAETGSIGVIRAGIDNTEALARNGLRRIRIISTNAPKKSPDPSTAAGRGVIQDGVDAMERIFIDIIASARGVTAKTVIDNFGKGDVLVAQDPDPEKPDAFKSGMIDSVITQQGEITAPAATSSDDIDEVTAMVDNSGSRVIPINPETTAQGGGNSIEEVIIMDLKTLKAEYPAVYALAVGEGVTQGIEQGVAQERDRVEAHATLGEASGDMKTALACIKDGLEVTAVVSAKHMAASMNKKAVDNRSNESPDAGDLPANADNAEAADKTLADALAVKLGVEVAA